MEYTTKTGNAADIATDCLVVPRRAADAVAGELGIGEQVELLLAGTRGAVAKAFRADAPSRLLVIGRATPGDEAERQAGQDAQEAAAARFRKDMNAAAAAIAALDVEDATLCLDDFADGGRGVYWQARTALAAISHAAYRFDAHKSKPARAAKLRRVGVLSRRQDEARRAVRHAQALDAGLALAKDLGNQPPNVCDPDYVAGAAETLAAENATVRSIAEDEMEELGMGAFLAVSRGSEKPGRMIVADYRGGAEDAPPIVLIGKGITFDTGGINLKSGGAMGEMKFDMCGAASVLGAAKAAIDAALPVNLVAIAAAAENMPSGRATRPSDIVTTLSGKTVEITNTDAEGRLVLCDALTYAERFEPSAVVDVATLTGAQVTALGSTASALYANDDALADALLAAGDAAGDRLWRMPLWDDYQEALKSPYADMKNVGGRAAGSITAACFLSRFAGAFRWAHLDIAGPAFRAGRGSTGRPVPALFQYLLDAAGEGA